MDVFKLFHHCCYLSALVQIHTQYVSEIKGLNLMAQIFKLEVALELCTTVHGNIMVC